MNLSQFLDLLTEAAEEVSNEMYKNNKDLHMPVCESIEFVLKKVKRLYIERLN